MEMEFSQADAAKHLNVFRSVFHRLWNQYQPEASVSRRHVPGRSRATTPAGDHFIALSDRRRRRISVPQLVASGRRKSASKNVCSSRGNEAPDIMNPTLLKDTVTEVVEEWFGEGSQSIVTLLVFQGGTLTDVRYWDEILDPSAHLYVIVIGNDFVLMDDNARPHRAAIFEEYLEGLSLDLLEWSAQSPDLNPIEHLWNYFCRHVAALSPSSRSLGELEQSLLPVWSSLPILVTDNLIDSMEIRCCQCIQATGGLIPY
ncbi:transposable element Tcb2 transposase [Trichonephila clavipes]|nr:transposable element Tcb2 transposase [Trichonephila clavipes]